MRRASLSLRGRFLLASMLLSGVLVGGFSLAIQHFLDVIEDEFISAEFGSEFKRLLADYHDRGKLVGTNPPGFDAFVVTRDGDGRLAPVLRRVPLGVHTQIQVGSREFTVGKELVAGGTLYVVYDQSRNPVERLERRLLEIALWAGISALLFSLALALWLSRVVLRPVELLAETVSAITPGPGRAPLLATDERHEIAVIARAFDATLARFDDFAERERAFTRDASHELRTPLAVISSGLQLIERDATLAVEQRVRIARVQSAAAQMQALVEGLLFLSRDEDIERNGPAFSVGGMLQDAARTLTAAAGNRPPAINVNVERDHEMSVPRGLLLCVVNNLLRNALEHSESRRIDVALAGPELVIQDYGKGIERGAQARVFDKDMRGPGSSGEGVGLHLVKRICDRLGWRIELSSAAGAGARFALQLA